MAIQAEWGIYSMLNKLKRAALGAHTPHDKATAASKPVPMPLPAQVRILMSQHIGAPAKALVKKGDEVFVGTKIGEAGGFVSANIHSSVSGTVAAVEPFRLSNGRMCDSVVIKTDGKQSFENFHGIRSSLAGMARSFKCGAGDVPQGH